MLLTAIANPIFTPMKVLTEAVAFCAAMDSKEAETATSQLACFTAVHVEKEIQETRPSVMKVRFGVATVMVTAASKPSTLAAQIASPRPVSLPRN